MKNSERYHYHVSRFIDAADKINAEYNDAMSRAKPFEGSAGGRAMIDKATAQRDAALKAEKDDTGKAIREIIESMRENARARKITAPTTEQVNLLTVLKMRGDSLTADEIKQAANNMQDCPAAIAVLCDLARERGLVVGLKGGSMTTDYIMQHIDNLERNAYAMFKGDNARFGRTPADLGDCMTRWGSFNYAVTIDEGGRQHTAIPSDTITAFCAAVDGEEGADT